MDEQAGGWTGKLLRIDLTTKEIKVESSLSLVNHYPGGRGLGQWVIFNEIPVTADPLEKENVMVFSCGPLTGTMAPASCRLSIDAKNPVTGGMASSNMGGHFAPELKFAGFDAVIVTGQAPAPVYLYINNGKACLKHAENLWGLGTRETENRIKQELMDKYTRIISIGPAGENLVKSACIIGDESRAAGRGALGAVMGSKNLKALAVRGTQGFSIFNPGEFLHEVNQYREKLNRNEVIKTLRTLGTPATIPGANQMCRLPVRNFQDDHWPEDKINSVHPEEFKNNYRVRKLSCFNCPVFCSAFYRIKNGEFAGLACEGFEANLVWNFQSRIDINHPPAALKFHEMCIDLGLDIDNSSGVIAWALELFEKGIITKKDTGGLTLKWGDYTPVMELLHKIAYREGFGDILARGVKEASSLLQRESEYFAIHVKNQELVEGIRSLKGWALGTVVAPRGGGHLNGAITTEIGKLSRQDSRERFGVETAGVPTSYEGKPQVVFWFEKFKSVVDMMGLCCFITCWLHYELPGLEEITRLFNAATGKNLTAGEIMKTGQRIHNLEKAFNTLHAGFQRQDDYPPRRLMDEPIKSGPFKGEMLEQNHWDKMLDEYYNLHGWDPETGLQTRSGLEGLGMESVLEKLKNNRSLVEK